MRVLSTLFFILTTSCGTAAQVVEKEAELLTKAHQKSTVIVDGTVDTVEKYLDPHMDELFDKAVELEVFLAYVEYIQYKIETKQIDTLYPAAKSFYEAGLKR